MHEIYDSTNTGVMNITAHLSSNFTATFCSKITRSLVKLINPWKHCTEMCNHDVSMTNKSPDWRGLLMVHGCKSPLKGAFYGSLVTN